MSESFTVEISMVMDKKMNNYSGEFLNKLVLVFILVMALGLTGCGGGGGSDPAPTPNPDTTPTPVPTPATDPTNISGGGIKGPLANAEVTIFAFDVTQSGFKGAVVTTASTDASSAITGLNLPLPLKPPYIMEFTSVPGSTIDITTCPSPATMTCPLPVITTIRTVITQTLLAGGKDIYATPLTTLAVDIAVMNAADTNGTADIQADEFEAALALAATKVVSTFGFGLDRSVDIFDTPPLINSATISAAEQANVAAYRAAVEAVTAIAYQISQQSANATADTVLADLAADLADNGVIDGSAGSALDANTLQVLQQDPASLPIPTTDTANPTNLTVGDVLAILVTEMTTTGVTTPTTDLTNGNIVIEISLAEPNPDIDGDGVLNVDDAFPNSPLADTDTDGDGLPDVIYLADVGNDSNSDGLDDRLVPAVIDTAASSDADDDNDNWLDAEDDFPLDATRFLDSALDRDRDTVANGLDNCPLSPNADQTDANTNGLGDVCDDDVDGDGISNDGNDNCPLNANPSQIDTDNDTTGDACDADIDGDSVLNATDAFPFDRAETIDTDGDGIGDNTDTDDDNDGVNDTLDTGVSPPPVGELCSLLQDCDGDGVLDGADADPTDPNIRINFAPVANNDMATVDEGQSVNINLAANDIDDDNALELSSIFITLAPFNGELVLNANGTADYTHDDSETVEDSFTYTILDASGAVSNEATVSIIVNPVNDPPVAISINAIANTTVNENSAYSSVTPAITGTPIGAVTYTLGGTDATLFTINSSNGVVNMIARNFESPADANTDNIYELSITVMDADGNSDSEPWSVTVVDVVEVSAISINTIANASVNENSIYTSVTPAITGTPIGAVTYALGGTDAADFTVNASTGVVSMVARDFEAPVDANTDNIYDLSISANDADGNSASQSWTVSVQNVVEVSAISINAIANASVKENSAYSSVTPVITGTPIGAVTYALGGTDAADFTVNASTGVVSMVARDFESPADANADNIYELSITATDTDTNSATMSWSVTVVDVTETATFTINTISNASVNENSAYTSVTPAITGTPIGAVAYTLSGTDAADFTINVSTGAVSMVARDFESPVDANTDNIYDLSITATDTDSNSASTSWSVMVADITEAATFTIDTISNASVNENSVYTSVTPAITGTPIGAVSYTLGGTDAALFTINSGSGVVSMVVRDFENPADVGVNNVYDLTIAVTDADGNSDSEPWSVTVVDVIESAAFTINAISNVSVNENSVYTSVTPVITGTPIGSVAYSLSGTDAAGFTINDVTGVVSMVARNFEAPVDANTDNVYALTITATDTNNNTASQSWTVSVQDVAEVSAISINAIANATVNENSTYTSVTPAITGTPIGTLTYTLSGTDAADFTINASTGVVSMVARDFESPADANTDNIYDLRITATDADGNTASEVWSVTVVDVVEVSAISIDTIANATVNENSVYTSVTPAITGTPIGAVTYALGGTDATLFTINGITGVVSMVARDFETPVDVNTDNIYDLSITATDADGNTASAFWSVTVVDVIETATFTINTISNASVNENSAYTSVTPAITGTPIGTLTYALSGTDAADFTINAATGVVSMVARNFESPADANTDNIYDLTITATDTDTNSATTSWNVTIIDVVEVSAISINTIANASVNENSIYTSVTPTLTGSPIGVVKYVLGGTDVALFTINSSTGVVSMVARNFESPADAGSNNVYDLSITVTDADGNSDVEAWSVTVADVTEAAIFTINTINNTSVNENSVYTGITPAITGAPIGLVTYTLSGTDAADFTINADTGVVSMVVRNFEAPVDANTDNVYNLSITATDADVNNAAISWSVTVTDVTEAATFTIDTISNASVNENSVYTSVTPAITGTPIGSVTYTLDGADASLFTINSNTGVVSMVVRDFENPADAGGNNVYDLSITVTDADGNTDSELWSVTVVDVVEVSAISINAIANTTVSENNAYTSVTPTITGTPIGTVTYTLSGTDAADFTINASTGVVSMVARDFESPADANTDNVYSLSITVTDADGNNASQSWSVNVQDVVEVSAISINAIANVSVNENSAYSSVTPAITGTPIGAVTYTLSGVDAADFTINAVTGVVSMVARDFEAPADADFNNVYDLSITVTDADGNSDVEAWSVTIADVTEAAIFTINTISNASVNENSVYTSVTPAITGTPIGAVTYTLSGTDAADFTIDASTGVVSMVARDFELPADADANNVYALTITATDTNSNTASQSWTVSVQNVVELLAIDDSASVNEGQSVNIDLAINDTADNALNLSSIVITSAPLNAVLVVNVNGTVDYMHDGSETVADLFTYTILDTSGAVSNNATVRLTINPVNDAPVANDDNVTTTLDTTFFFNVLANDTDIDGDVLSVSQPTSITILTNGSLVNNGGGTFTYTPNPGFVGTDSFTYTVTDSIASAVGTVTITVTPPGTPIDIITLMSAAEGGVAGIENAETNVYAYWTDNYDPVSAVFSPEDKVYNHLSGVFDTVVNNGDLLLSGTQWVSEGDIIGTDDGNGGLDLTIHDADNANVEVARFKLTAHYQDLSFLPIKDHLNTVWQQAMVNTNATFNVGAKLITDYRFETLVESHVLGQDSSCQRDGTTKFADLNGNCNSVDVDAVINATAYAQLLNDVVAATAWIDPGDFSTPPGAVTIATNNVTNKTLMVQLVSGGAVNYYVVDWNSTSAFTFVANAVAGPDWVQNTDSGVDMIHFQVPASFITQFSDDLSAGLNYFLTVQNGFVRQGLKHAIGDAEFSDGQFNGNALDNILANFSAPVIPGLTELTGTWLSSVVSANGDPALIHIFVNANYESSGSCDLDGSTGMEYGTVSADGSTTDIIAIARVATQGLCGPAQGNKTLAVNGDVLTLSEPGFADIVYNRLLGTLNPIVGSWLFGNIQDPGEAHTILTMLDDTTFTLSQDCTTELVSGFEYGTYVLDQGNNLTGTLTIDSNGGCGLHDNTALTISGFTVTVFGDTLTLADSVGGNFIFTRISPAYVIPMLQVVYTLDNLIMDQNNGQITGSFTWSYVEGDFAGGSGQFTDLFIPGYGTDFAALKITFNIEEAIQMSLAANTNNNGLDISLNLSQPLSLMQPSLIDTATSSYDIEINGRQVGLFVDGTITPQGAP